MILIKSIVLIPQNTHIVTSSKRVAPIESISENINSNSVFLERWHGIADMADKPSIRYARHDKRKIASTLVVFSQARTLLNVCE